MIANPIAVSAAARFDCGVLPPVTAVKLNTSGVVSVNTVVAVKVPTTPPTVRTAWAAVFGVAEAVTLATTV